MASSHNYVMTGKVLGRLGPVDCLHCERGVKVGDAVHSTGGHRGKRKIWHDQCYRGLYR